MCRTEHANQAKKRQADLKLPVLLETNEALSLPVRIEGLQYLEIIITGRSFNWYLVRQLPWPCVL
jgi:protein-tyrosine phosphatase